VPTQAPTFAPISNAQIGPTSTPSERLTPTLAATPEQSSAAPTPDTPAPNLTLLIAAGVVAAILIIGLALIVSSRRRRMPK
jgi:hypothetical protein